MRFIERVCLLGLCLGYSELFAGDPVNLLSFNASFEDSKPAFLQHGISDESLGWITEHSAFTGNQIIKSEDAPEGGIVFVLAQGGRVETSPEGRGNVQAGKNYEFRFDSKKIAEKEPALKHGLLPSIDFYDSQGQLLERKSGEKVQIGDVTGWEKLTMQAVAPAGSAKAGVRVYLDRGIYPKSDTAKFQLDNFQLWEIPTPVAVSP